MCGCDGMTSSQHVRQRLLWALQCPGHSHLMDEGHQNKETLTALPTDQYVVRMPRWGTEEGTLLGTYCMPVLRKRPAREGGLTGLDSYNILDFLHL